MQLIHVRHMNSELKAASHDGLTSNRPPARTDQPQVPVLAAASRHLTARPVKDNNGTNAAFPPTEGCFS